MRNRTEWFTHARFGMFIHWGIYSIPAQGEWIIYQKDLNMADYERYAAEFNPVDFDPGSWADLAKDAGMKYVVFTTKHHDGFCMFDSRYTDYKITRTPYGRDITRELVDAFRERGIRIGFYHSLVDWRHPHFIPDPEHPLGKHGKTDWPGRDRRIYQKYLYSQVEQLMSDYGKIDLLFFDYTSRYKTSEEWDPEHLLEMVYRLQPEIIVNDRLSFDKSSFTGDYLTPEISVPNHPLKRDGAPVPWETCMTMNNHWGYAEDDHDFKEVSTVMTALTQCVSKNGNLLFNVGPDSHGNIPEEGKTLLRGIAEWFSRNGEAVTGAGAAPFTPPSGMHYTATGEKTIYLHIPFQPMGDIILPQLRGKVAKITLLQDGSEVKQITWWGEELLHPEELRIRTRPGKLTLPAVLKLELL